MKKQIVALLTGILLVVCHAFGQASDGNIGGTILDSTGATVPGTAVTLSNQDTGVKAATISDANGLYRFQNVLVGKYTVTAVAKGFTGDRYDNGSGIEYVSEPARCGFAVGRQSEWRRP